MPSRALVVSRKHSGRLLIPSDPSLLRRVLTITYNLDAAFCDFTQSLKHIATIRLLRLTYIYLGT